MFRYLLAGLFLVSFSVLFAQTGVDKSIALTGNLTQDSKILAMNTNPMQKNALLPDPVSKKNPMLAGLFSLIVPGSGQFYTEHYIEAGVFAAIEASVIAIAIHYNNKGNTQTDYFQGVGDNEWSVVRYAEYLNRKNKDEHSDLLITISTDESLPTWKRVDWAKVNAAELGSHKLPIHGTQQYYELIGKYNEYNPGWYDYSTLGGDNSLYDPVVSGGNTVGTKALKTYAGYRGKANDYYDYASHAVIALYINHFLSVVDAIWDAVSFNKNIAFKSNVESQMIHGKSDYLTTLTMSVAF